MNKSDILHLIYEYAEENLKVKEFIPGKTNIPASYPKLHPIDIAVMEEVLLSFWYTEHKQCKKFETQLTEWLAKRHAILTNSGSSASLVAVTACTENFLKHHRKANIVVTCATGFPTTVAPIYQNNCIPYYIDIDPITLSPNIEQLAEILEHEKGISGVILAHTLGFPFDEAQVKGLVGDKRWFIADCCDALAAELCYNNNDTFPCSNWVGEFADVQTHSFFPAHIITSIEGGAVLTDNTVLAEIMRSIVNWGRSCFCEPGQSNTCGHRFDWQERGKLPEKYDHKYIFDRLGYNLKMTEFQAALGYSQLIKIDEFRTARRNNFHYLRSQLRKYEEFLQFVEIPEWSKPVPFGFPVLVKETAPFTDEQLIAFLEEHKISTRRVFAGNITKQPGYMNFPYMKTDLSGSDEVMNRMFWFGCHPSVTHEMMDYILEVFGEFMKWNS